jgi:TonB family protein
MLPEKSAQHTAVGPFAKSTLSYSEEARKAKFAGIVTLWIVVNAQGLVRNIRVANSLGMALDEEAVKTV